MAVSISNAKFEMDLIAATTKVSSDEETATAKTVCVGCAAGAALSMRMRAAMLMVVADQRRAVKMLGNDERLTNASDLFWAFLERHVPRRHMLHDPDFFRELGSLQQALRQLIMPDMDQYHRNMLTSCIRHISMAFTTGYADVDQLFLGMLGK